MLLEDGKSRKTFLLDSSFVYRTKPILDDLHQILFNNYAVYLLPFLKLLIGINQLTCKFEQF